MNYYAFNIGDYIAHTAHLSVAEDCAYRRLLDQYYLTEKCLPLDVKACARMIRMRDQEQDVECVLREFFTETDSGWVHARCDSEILKYQDKNEKAKASARASVNSRRAPADAIDNERSTNAQRTLNERSTNVELNKKQEPRTNTPSDEGVTRKRATHPARPDEVPESVWQDFQALRKAKRAALTDTAMDGIKREAAKAGIGLAEALAYCCQAGWQGFNAGWYADRKGNRPTATEEPAWRTEQRSRMAEFAPMAAAKPRTENVIDMETTHALAR